MLNNFSILKFFNKNYLIFFKKRAIINKLIIEAWLSLVERCVRDAEVVGSNPVASTRVARDLRGIKIKADHWWSAFIFFAKIIYIIYAEIIL